MLFSIVPPSGVEPELGPSESPVRILYTMVALLWCPWRDLNPQWPFGSLSVRSGVFCPIELHGH